jgi:uncharacterized protein DUF3891
MVLAAEPMTTGWWNWDIYPSIDNNGVPIPFTRTPREFRSTFYGKGIDNVIARDFYAGLIVSMHGVGLPQKSLRHHAGLDVKLVEAARQCKEPLCSLSFHL